MKRTNLLILLISLSLSTLGQYGKDYGVFGNTSQQFQYVLADTLIVRGAPNASAQRLDTLYAGDRVEVLRKESNDLQLKGILAPWFLVNYGKSGIKKEGYVWSGNLAFNSVEAAPLRYVMGVERVTSKDTLVGGSRVTHYAHQLRLKAVRNGTVVDSRTFVAQDPQYLATFLERRGNGGGLKLVQDVIYCRLSSEVSGMPSFTHAFAWDGRRLKELPRTINVVDGDALYYTEKLILPDDKGGSPDTITWSMEQGEMTGKKDKKGQPVYKTDSKMKKYPWKG